MKRPQSKPWIVRKLLYYYQALTIPTIVSNWDLVVREYFGINPPNKSKIVRLHNGLRFKIGHFLDVWGIKEVIGENDYHLKPDPSIKTIVDIGANIGTFSIRAALTYPKAKIYSFEPSATTFSLLHYNLKVNGVASQVQSTQKAVFSKVKKLKLYSAGPSGVRSLFRSRGESNFEIVNTTTLPQIMSRLRIKKVDYLKMDCEGAEYEIFESLKRIDWNKFRRISLEFHELVPGQNHQNLLSVLKKYGFKTRASYHPIENSIGYIYAWK